MSFPSSYDHPLKVPLAKAGSAVTAHRTFHERDAPTDFTVIFAVNAFTAVGT